MNIIATTLEDTYGDFRRRLVIKIDGKIVFEVRDGEPEDSNLYRDFRDCFKITDLMKRAWEAGKVGEKFNLTTETKKDD